MSTFNPEVRPAGAGKGNGAAPARDPAACLRRSIGEAVPDGASVLLAVSGGSDSMALLALAQQQLPDRIAVIHVRHHLRADAEREAALVQDTCAALAVPCLALDAGPSAEDPARTETAARSRRLAALRAAADRTGARWIALAHHRDDDLETLVLRLQRGHFGDRALAGIPTVRALGGGVHLLRPFLVGVAPPDRADLARCRQAAGLPHADDPSNVDERIARNRVRAALARGEPAPGAALLALRNAARARLAHRLAAATTALALGLQREGLGARLSLDALDALAPLERAPARPTADRAADCAETLAELLRLLGGCFRIPRRMDPRATVLRDLAALLARRAGDLTLPASPAPLRVHVSRDALHFPDEPLQPGSADARALQALLQTSLYL